MAHFNKMNTTLGMKLLERGNAKEFYKGVSCKINDFAVRGSKLISCYDQFKWLR